jgi:hypothetical protein
MATTSAPSPARLAQTFAAPPNTARSLSRNSTVTGASGDKRSKSKCFMDPQDCDTRKEVTAPPVNAA